MDAALQDIAIQKAKVLVEALGWIRRFRDRYVVIKLGGSSLDQTEAVNSLLTDLIFMEAVGMHPVLVHGGGKAISAAMNGAGIEATFVQGRRYTDEATLEIVSRVLASEICGDLVDRVKAQGGEAVGLSYLSTNCLTAERLTLTGDNGAEADLGYVGRIVDVDCDAIRQAGERGEIPVIPSIGMEGNGQRYNVNADTAAAAVARALNAEKLVFLSDVPGIFLDRHDPGTLQSHLTAARCRELIADGTIDSGMVPKVEAALDALDVGVRKVHIVDARMPHSVLLEIYSDTGVGTEIVS